MPEKKARAPRPAAAGPAAASPRRTGRPRSTGQRVEGDVVDEILAAASTLFGQQGVDATTMSRIAAAAGLRQPSLYYYFRRKEELIAALVARANVVPLHLARALVAGEGSTPAQLHRFVHDDVVALCRLPFDINEVHRIAARDADGFADYWSERNQLQRLIARMVRTGCSEKTFRPVDAHLTALTVLGTDEGVQNWYRVGPRLRPRAIGLAVADLVVGGLLTHAERLPDVRSEATTLVVPPAADFQ
jgi:AcrR family transcriptional regulator